MKPVTSCLSLVSLFAFSVSAFAVTCAVPTSGYPTIQAAVDDPTCNTINVGPGLFPENVSVSRSVVINGAQAGQPVAGRLSGGPAESIVSGVNPAGPAATFLVSAPSVTIDGFTIKNAVAAGSAMGVEINRASNDAVVINNFIDGIASTDATAAGTAQAVSVHNGVLNVNVGNNDIRNVTSTGNAFGVLLADDDNLLPDTEIAYLHHNTVTAISSATGGAAAFVCRKIALTAGNLQISDNIVSGVTGASWARGVSLEAHTRVYLVIVNDFAGLSSGSGDVAAVWINNPAGYSGDVGGNNYDLPPTAFGVKVHFADPQVAAPPLSAGCSWWGSADGPGPVGPGHGCQVSPNVLFINWRIVPSHQSPCNGSNTPVTEADCKNGGWITHVRADGSTFKSQGDCIQLVNKGK
ncbi:MAG TPA: hypothetical protein VM940_13860 [Chthoniobacterales bacterium]|nr:hypothetical protein [Chthoniobacterales bacterium]